MLNKIWYLVGAVILLPFIFWLLFLNHVSVNELGVSYDPMNGKITKQEQAGWYITHPLVQVSYIETLPFKVTIPSDARVIVQKLVRFNPDGLQEYIDLQGFSYSLNSSLQNTFLGYSYSGRSYPFLEILQELELEKLPSHE